MGDNSVLFLGTTNDVKKLISSLAKMFKYLFLLDPLKQHVA